MKKKVFFVTLAAIVLVSTLVSCDKDTYIENDPIAAGYKFVDANTVRLYDKQEVEVEERSIEVKVMLQADQYLMDIETLEFAPDEESLHIYNSLFMNSTVAKDGSIHDTFHYIGYDNHLRVYGLQIIVEGADGSKEELMPMDILHMSAEIRRAEEDDEEYPKGTLTAYDICYTLSAGSKIVLDEKTQRVYTFVKKESE